MVLIKKPQEIYRNFNKEEIIQNIIETIQNKYPDYHLIKRFPIKDIEPEVWDLLIIRTNEYTVKEIIGKMNHESIKERKFQQVFAVRVEHSEVEYSADLSELKKWVTQFILTDNVRSVLRALELTL
jgi:hypothetical protein